MGGYTDLALLAQTDVGRLLDIADEQAEKIRQLEADICGHPRLVIFLACHWGLTQQESKLLALILTLSRASYQTLQEHMDINKPHLEAVLCHLRKKLPPKAITTVWGVGLVVETAMRAKLLEGFEE